MVNRNPAAGFGSTHGTSVQDQPQPTDADGLDAQVIPLHAATREHRTEQQPERASGHESSVALDEYGTRADADVVRFPGGVRSDEAPPISPSRRPAVDSEPAVLPTAVGKALDFLRGRLTGDYTVDEFGFDAELTESVVLPALRVLYEKWFRVSATGATNLPTHGGALVVCNHSGTLPIDALMTAVAVHDEHPERRHLRLLAADLVFQLPFVGQFARKAGHTLASNPDAERLLRAGELVGVFPEGFKGIGKPFASRYKLQRFGRGGFVSAAVRAGVPIIPCSIVGAEEIYPKIGDVRPLARLLGLPYFPITPLFPLLGPLGAVPLPTKWNIEFGQPIRTDLIDDSDADPMLVLNLTDRVREAIQQQLYTQLNKREGIF